MALTSLVSLHLVSDLHLEFYCELERELIPLPLASADVLVLCGDNSTTSKQSLSNLSWYLDQVRSQFKQIIYVLGNHEFYGTSLKSGLKTFEKFCVEREIILLDVNLSPCCEIFGKVFFGATLWSDLKNGDWFIKTQAKVFMNDFKMITNFDTYSQLEQNFLTRSMIESVVDKVDVFVTHYKPIVTSHSFYGFNDHSYWFGNTSLESILQKCKARVWFYGHTHDNQDHWVDSTLISSNQVGYKSSQEIFQRLEVKYDPSRIYLV